MAFTAQLGIGAAYPGNIVLGLGSIVYPSASSVWDFAGAATGAITVSGTTPRTTQVSGLVILEDAQKASRVTQVWAAALVSEAARDARVTAVNALVIYQPLQSRSTWEFGGLAIAAEALTSSGVWEFAGRAVGLVDGIHIAGAAGGWMFSGSATGRNTGTATGSPEGVWEFGGSVVVEDGTSEECITGDGTASDDDDGAISNYVF